MSQELSGQKVIISGGGIGGAAGALALALRGADVALYERAREFKEVGAGLQIGPHGWRMLKRWGVLEALVEKGYLPEYMQFKDAINGGPILTMHFDEDFEQHFGGRYMVVHRSDLLALLLDAARDAGAELVNGVVVTGCDTVDNGIDVHLHHRDNNQDHTVHADVLLAFDGIHSVMRPRLVQDEPVPSAYVAYRGTTPISEDPEAANINGVIGYIGPHCHFIQYKLRGGDMLNQVGVFQSDRYLDGRDAGNIPDDWGNNDELATAYNHCIPYIKERTQKLWKDQWWQMSDREPLREWVDGRMILLGDAAHPPLQYLASGAVMAMEDAEALATFASDSANLNGGTPDWDAVLKEVEAERAPRAARIQTTGRFWGELWHLPGTARLLRNYLFNQAEDNWYRYADWLWHYDPVDRAYIKNPSLGDLPQELREWTYTLTQRA